MTGAQGTLSTALEHPANDLKSVLWAHDLKITGNRCAAFWRGSSDPNVFVGAYALTDYVSGESFGVWRVLTELLGYSEDEAQHYLLARAGLSDTDATPVRRRLVSKTTPQSPRNHPAKLVKAGGALGRWQTLSTSGRSPYLDRKGVADAAAACSAIRYGRGSISVQMSRITPSGDLEPVSIQTITTAGGKRFAKGVSTRGTVALVGSVSLKAALKTGHVWLAEGLATALTVHMATGAAVLACFSAGSLGPVVKALRAFEPSSRKLRLFIAADDDRFNKPEAGNAGLEKAHRAALTYRCTVCSPTFANHETRPTDFNDLHTLEGLEAVREQLGTPANPDPALAFAPERRRRKKLSERRRASSGRYLPAQSFGPGVTVLRAPHGTGKTERVAEQVAAAVGAGERVLYVSHSAALAENAARRLHLESYSDELHRRHLTAVPGLSICLNSLPRLLENGVLADFDLVVIDESEQLVRASTGSHIANRAGVLETMTLLVQKARRVVCLDADAGKLTRELLELARPRERITWRAHAHPVGQGRTLRVHESKNGVYGALDTLTEPALVVTNSKYEAEALYAHLKSRGRRARVLTGEHLEDDADFMLDIEGNARAEQLDVLVCSPTVRTGVSLEGGYFKHVGGIFYGTVGTPEDALQALWRVRTVCSYDIWLDPAVRTERLDLEVKYAKLTPKTPTEATYNRLKHAVELAEQRSQAYYRLNFLQLAALQGFSFELLDSDPKHKGLATAARELADAEHYDRVEAARELSVEAAQAFRRRVDAGAHVSREDRSALERYRVADFYRLAAKDDLRAALELDRRGRYQGQLEKLELALDTPEGILERELAEADRRPLEADRRPLTARHELYSRVLNCVGFGAAARLVMAGRSESTMQLDLPRYTSKELEPLRVWIEQNRSWLAGVIALPDAARLKENPVRYVGSWLKVLGLKQKRVGKNELASYALEVAALETACKTLKRRGDTFLLKGILRKSVPTLPPNPDAAGGWLSQLLEAGHLDAFGPERVQTIRQKLRENATEWLYTLATSTTFARMVGGTA